MRNDSLKIMLLTMIYYEVMKINSEGYELIAAGVLMLAAIVNYALTEYRDYLKRKIDKLKRSSKSN